jgi:adenylate kinase
VADVDGGPRVVLLGAPGSGKGTQAALLSRRLGVPAISTGELLREAVAAKNALGERVASVLSSGQLVADDLMAEMVKERLGRDDARAGFLLDGYPRTPAQADTLDRVLADCGAALDAVVLLRVPQSTLLRRALGRGRADDNEAVIRERLRLFAEKTMPLMGYYEDRGLMREVDGDRPVDEVTSQLLAALNRRGDDLGALRA